MRLIPNGPDIPEDLLYEQEQGNVVFFCGAGVSCSAGLPGYGGLVCELYKQLDTFQVREEETLFNQRQYDNLLWALEQRVSRECLNNALLAILKRYMRSATSGYHKDLLTLSTDSHGVIRLVTTNYDTLFEKVSKEDYGTPKFQIYAAPALPVPKKNSWNGLVYLHGRIPEEEDDDPSLNRLVITSADYGHAYLKEGWATRFLLELFRNFTVCFIGYSLSDPIIRYLTDALAVDWFWTDRMPTPYAFTSDENEDGLWRERGITPIYYNKEGDHSALRDTLAEWARMYLGGDNYKVKKVEQILSEVPSGVEPNEPQRSQVLWALAHPSGEPAKKFADRDPSASSWLPMFFWPEAPEKGFFSLVINQPEEQRVVNTSAENFSQEATLPRAHISRSQPLQPEDVRVKHLLPWIIRHCKEPGVLETLYKEANNSHSIFLQMLELALFNRSYFDLPHEQEDLIVSLRVILHLICRKPVKFSHLLNPWKEMFVHEGLNEFSRTILRRMLTPTLDLNPSLALLSPSLSKIQTDHCLNSQINLIGEAFEITPSVSLFAKFETASNQFKDKWKSALPDLLDVFEPLLREALDLRKALKKADANSDGSIWVLPSIEDHDTMLPKRSSYKWGDYILLLRDAWLALNRRDEKSAAQLAQGWFEIPYPTFKRLALFAASHNPQIPTKVWGQWLLSVNGKWLWSVETRRETMRLFATRGADLTGQMKEDLETKVLEGPPDDTFSSSDKKCREIALRLKKLERAGCALSQQAQAWLSDPKNRAKDTKLFDDQREEFPFWIELVDTTEPTETWTTAKIWNRDYLTKCLMGIAHGLPAPEIVRRFWPELCRKDPENVGAALLDTLERTQFAISNDLLDMIKTAFLIWAGSGPRLGYRTWNCFRGSIRSFLMNSSTLAKELFPSVAYWAENVSKTVNPNDPEFFEFLRQLFTLARDLSEAKSNWQLSQLDDALKTPIGVLTQALFVLCFRRDLSSAKGIPEDLQPLFSEVFENSSANKRLQPARGVAAAWAMHLYRLAPEWTKKWIVPLFSWSESKDEASFIWQCYLKIPDLYFPLFLEFWEDFFKTFRHIDNFNEEGKKHLAWQLLDLAQYLIHTRTNIDPDKEFNKITLDAFYGLNSEMLAFVISRLFNNLCEARSPEDYFRVYVVPFWKKYWPKDIRLNSKITAANLAKIAIKSKNQFEKAFDLFKAWLIPLDPEYSQELLEMPEAEVVAEEFPSEMLLFLNKVVDTSQQCYHPQLKNLLEKIREADPGLEKREEYKKLADFCDRAMPYQ